MKRKSGKAKAEALRLHDAGVSRAQIVRQLKKQFREDVSEGCIRRWVRLRAEAAEVDQPASSPVEIPFPDVSPAPEPPAEDEPEDLDVDAVEDLQRTIRNAKRMAKLAEREGNMTAAARMIRDALNGQNTLARLKAAKKDAEDGVFIPRADVERIRREMIDRVQRLEADLKRTGGLVCSHCGREIRLQLAKEG